MNVLPKYYYVRKQLNRIKGWEPYYNKGFGWSESLGFFKTKKEANEAVEKHKQSKAV